MQATILYWNDIDRLHYILLLNLTVIVPINIKVIAYNQGSTQYRYIIEKRCKFGYLGFVDYLRFDPIWSFFNLRNLLPLAYKNPYIIYQCHCLDGPACLHEACIKELNSRLDILRVNRIRDCQGQRGL